MKKIFSLFFFVFISLSFSFAQNVGINADASLPNSSAMLDVKSANKGMLIPRVALTGTTDVTTVPSPVTSLMVYNTTAAGSGTTAVIAGYYYWNGTAWVRVVSSTSTGNSTNKTFIPFASGSNPLTLTASLATPTVGLIGFGSSGTTTVNSSAINLTSGPNFAFVVPSSGTITDISGFFSNSSTFAGAFPISITCRVYVSTASNSNNFVAPAGNLLTLSPFYSGFSPAGTVVTGTSSVLNLAVTAGSRIILVVEVSDFFGGGSSISGYFSGGVNMIIQ